MKEGIFSCQMQGKDMQHCSTLCVSYKFGVRGGTLLQSRDAGHRCAALLSMMCAI